jgi:hypothetical protein
MPLKPVAKDGDVTATARSTKLPPAVSGSWTAGSVVTTRYPFMTIGGVAVIHQAMCTFSFTGTGPSPGNAPVSGTSIVTLTATSTTLQKGSTFVLRDGDTKQDSFGNTLAVSASNHVKSD